MMNDGNIENDINNINILFIILKKNASCIMIIIYYFVFVLVFFVFGNIDVYVDIMMMMMMMKRCKWFIMCLNLVYLYDI